MFERDGKTERLPYTVNHDSVWIARKGRAFRFATKINESEADAASGDGFTPEIISPMPGKILETLVSPGDVVSPETPLLRLEAMKMEQTVTANADARIVEVCVSPEEMVGPGATLLRLERIDTNETE